MTNLEYRSRLKDRKRIVVKVGSSSLLHPETQRLDYHKIDRLTRELSDLKNSGKDIILVSSGAAAAGREALHVDMDVYRQESPMNIKQACAAVGQARLIMIYQKFFEQYNQMTAQVLMTRDTVVDDISKKNLITTFTELLRMNVIPIVNENDSVATSEFNLGDNDKLSAIVASILDADLLVLLSDVDGLYTDDPRSNANAQFLEFIPRLDDSILHMGKSSTGSGAGTGGMHAKLQAARIASASGCDMVIVNSRHGMGILYDVVHGKNVGTLFCSDPQPGLSLTDFLDD